MLDDAYPCTTCRRTTYNLGRVCRHCLGGAALGHSRTADSGHWMELPPGEAFKRGRRMVMHRRRVMAELAAIEGRREGYD